MAFTQLNPTLPVTVEGKGKGLAFGVIDYSEEHHLIWVVAMNETSEVWCVPNPEIRVQSNWTFDRRAPIPPEARDQFAEVRFDAMGNPFYPVRDPQAGKVRP